MARYPEHDLATALDADGSIALPSPPGGVFLTGYGVAPSNIVRGPARDVDGVVPNEIINVLQTGGPPPMPLMGEAPNANIYQARVQVTVRSKVESYAAGVALARGIRDKLHLGTVGTPGTGLQHYIDVLAQESEPNYLGVDDRGLHRWTLNFLMRWRA